MKATFFGRVAAIAIFAGVSVSSLILTTSASAQSDLQERLNFVKEAAANNKKALAQDTWQEQDIISIKGEVKKVEHFQVQMGPDGKPQKTSLDPPPQVSDEEHRRRIREHIVEKKTEEYEDYGHQIAALGHSYAPPESEKLQQAFQQGNLTFGSAGVPNRIRIVISNYIKPNDSVTIVFDTVVKAIQTVQISSYLSDPADAVNITVQFGQLPDGTNHVASMNVDGVSKKLTVAVQNSNYQKM